MLLARIGALPPQKRRLLLGALAAVLRTRLALALRPAATMRHLEAAHPRAHARFTAVDAAWAIAAVSRRIPGTYCLARSIALHRLLARAGIASEVRIGVMRAGEGIAGHAWVVCEGCALDGVQQDAHTTLGTLPG